MTVSCLILVFGFDFKVKVKVRVIVLSLHSYLTHVLPTLPPWSMDCAFQHILIHSFFSSFSAPGVLLTSAPQGLHYVVSVLPGTHHSWVD